MLAGQSQCFHSGFPPVFRGYHSIKHKNSKASARPCQASTYRYRCETVIIEGGEGAAHGGCCICIYPLPDARPFFELWAHGFTTTTLSFSEISTNVRSGPFGVATYKVHCRVELDIPLGVALVSCMFASTRAEAVVGHSVL